MRHSIKPRDKTYVKGHGFLSFVKTMSNRYSQKHLDSAKKYTRDAIKTATHATKVDSKRAIQKAAETTGYLFGNKIADKITKKSSKELHLQNNLKEA